jgi:hypothetical protein
MIANFGAGRIAGKALTTSKALPNNACIAPGHALAIIFPIAFAQEAPSFYNAGHGALSITPTGM